MKSFLKKFPVFSGVLAFLLLVFLASLWCVWERRAAAQGTLAKLTELEASLQQLSGTVPAPTSENAAMIETAAVKAEAALADAKLNIIGKGAAYERMKKLPVPTHRNDAYFDLASFVERLRDRAQRSKVALSEQEMFSFGVYAHTGPEQDQIPAVFQQRLIAQYLAETLIDARPRRILSFQRERPLTASVKAAKIVQTSAEGGAQTEPTDAAATSADGSAQTVTEGEGGDASAAMDIFAIDPRLSAYKPGIIDTQAFRISFVCQTSALRTVLNKFASHEMPLFVRQIDVVTATEEEARPMEENAPSTADSSSLAQAAAAAAAAAAKAAESTDASPANGATATVAIAAPVPIVPRGFIKATLLVEFVELAPAPVQAQDQNPAATGTAPTIAQPPVATPATAQKNSSPATATPTS